MAKPLLDDDLWELLKPLLPQPKPRRSRFPGRNPLEPRKVLTGVPVVNGPKGTLSSPEGNPLTPKPGVQRGG
jgi:hypothetical protein